MASFAAFVATYPDFSLSAECGFFKFQSDVFTQIGAALGASAATAGAAEHVAKSEEVGEDVAEILEDGGIETASRTEPGAHAGMTETIVLRALIGVCKHRVSFG